MRLPDETEHAAPSQEERVLRLRTATLHWREGGENRRHAVKARALVGSSPDADVRIGDPMVSRLHLELTPAPDGLWLRDLGSTNGTYLNDVRIVEARAPTRAQLRLGGTELSLRYDAGGKTEVELWPDASFGRLLGKSLAMRALFAKLDRVAKSEAAVLITGETGSGKELVAEALHAASARADGPLVIVDCASLPHTLLESELFGHVRGAFTGAIAARVGAFESADGGTLFLDEIGELPLDMQPKLLRVLEAKTVRRVGETDPRPIDVRVVAATHRDLLAMVARGEFREDLYFRLGVVPVTVPPLRERREDIPLLVERFGGGALPPDIVSALSVRPFRGNVRELRNVVDRVRTLGAGALDALDDAPLGDAPRGDIAFDETALDQDYRAFREAWIDEGERRYAHALVARHDGNVSAAARAAKITRNFLHRLLRRHPT